MDDGEASFARRELRELHGKARESAEALKAQTEEILELAKRIEDLTDGTPAWYAGMRTRVEAGTTTWQARVLLDTLAELEERTSERST